eukprot:5155289-Pyramimonas_sp.AAC.1
MRAVGGCRAPPDACPSAWLERAIGTTASATGLGQPGARAQRCRGLFGPLPNGMPTRELGTCRALLGCPPEHVFTANEVGVIIRQKRARRLRTPTQDQLHRTKPASVISAVLRSHDLTQQHLDLDQS